MGTSGPSGKQILGGREISLLVDGAEIQMWSVLFLSVWKNLVSILLLWSVQASNYRSGSAAADSAH